MLVAAEEGAADERPCLTMFESKEEVERTMLALKIFPNIDQVVEAEQEDPETDEEEYAPQVHRSLPLDFLMLWIQTLASKAELSTSHNPSYLIQFNC